MLLDLLIVVIFTAGLAWLVWPEVQPRAGAGRHRAPGAPSLTRRERPGWEQGQLTRLHPVPPAVYVPDARYEPEPTPVPARRAVCIDGGARTNPHGLRVAPFVVWHPSEHFMALHYLDLTGLARAANAPLALVGSAA